MAPAVHDSVGAGGAASASRRVIVTKLALGGTLGTDSYILSPMKKPSSLLRERKKDATRRALVRAANLRFRNVGFAATTLDEICADAEVSRRTFFRYFDNKEALAFPHRAERLERFTALLDAAPPGESPIASLRRIAQLFAGEHTTNREQLLAQQRVIASSAALIAVENEIDRDWEDAMYRCFVRRLGGGDAAELRARVLAGACIGVIRATMRHWFQSGGRADLGQLGLQALDALHDPLPTPAD
ncbi:MAG: TetR family transcriptional regulator [Xanthomonadales bacterium]|nr:TetR family transcriptional regulator [Xanthomonadales bacterium]